MSYCICCVFILSSYFCLVLCHMERVNQCCLIVNLVCGNNLNQNIKLYFNIIHLKTSPAKFSSYCLKDIELSLPIDITKAGAPSGCREPTGSYNRLFEGLYVFEHKTQYLALWFSGTPLERPRKSHLSCNIWSVSMHHSLQIMFILPIMPGHLFWKATFFLGGLYTGVPLYFDISVICLHRFRTVKFVKIPPLFR